MLLLLQFGLDLTETSEDSSNGPPPLGLCFILRLIQILLIYRTSNLDIFRIVVNGVALLKCFFSYSFAWILMTLHRTHLLDTLLWGCALFQD